MSINTIVSVAVPVLLLYAALHIVHAYRSAHRWRTRAFTMAEHAHALSQTIRRYQAHYGPLPVDDDKGGAP